MPGLTLTLTLSLKGRGKNSLKEVPFAGRPYYQNLRLLPARPPRSCLPLPAGKQAPNLSWLRLGKVGIWAGSE